MKRAHVGLIAATASAIAVALFPMAPTAVHVQDYNLLHDESKLIAHDRIGYVIGAANGTRSVSDESLP